jgi:hypothetical protein
MFIICKAVIHALDGPRPLRKEPRIETLEAKIGLPRRNVGIAFARFEGVAPEIREAPEDGREIEAVRLYRAPMPLAPSAPGYCPPRSIVICPARRPRAALDFEIFGTTLRVARRPQFVSPKTWPIPPVTASKKPQARIAAIIMRMTCGFEVSLDLGNCLGLIVLSSSGSSSAAAGCWGNIMIATR